MLFDLIDSGIDDAKKIRDTFSQRHPETSLPNTIQYLSKLILQSLVECKTEKDTFFKQLHGIMELKVLQERSLHDQAAAKLKSIRRLAVAGQHQWIEYFTYRNELDSITSGKFHGIDDNELVSLQMKAKDLLRSLHHIQDHHTLFELLKYRLVHSGSIASDSERKKMNDLMLSEMALITGKSKDSFASLKLHLLFQGFFFTNTGDYQTALKTFHLLNQLFERNITLLEFPPMDYLSALNGIADSLYTLDKTQEIPFYLEKAGKLDNPGYPEYFRLQVRKIISVYELAVLIRQEKFLSAITYIESLDRQMMEMYNMVSEEKQWELYFYCSVAYMKMKSLKKAHHYILRIMQSERAQPHLPVCRAVRLLNIIIYFEQGEAEYVGYEIRSYKRFIAKQSSRFQSEKLLLRFIGAWPDKKNSRLSVGEMKKTENDLSKIHTDKYERHLLKYFDFNGWVVKKIQNAGLRRTAGR